MLDTSLVLWAAFLNLEWTRIAGPLSYRPELRGELQEAHCFRERIPHGLPDTVVFEDIG